MKENDNPEAGLKATFSKEDVAIVNAAFKLHEIIILHRIYKRGARNRYTFTRGALEAAKKALMVLRPPSPGGVDPVRVAAHFAKQHRAAEAAILSVSRRRRSKSGRCGRESRASRSARMS